MRRPISTRTHGVLDYTAAATLYALPRMLGWSDRVTDLLTKAALGTLAYSLITRYELGAVKVLPMRAHLALDAMSGAAFCAAPWLLPDEDETVTTTLAGIGLFELSAAFLTETESPAEIERRLPELDPADAYPALQR